MHEVLTWRRQAIALTLALLGYTTMLSSSDTPTPMQIPLILLIVTCKAPTPQHTANLQFVMCAKMQT